MHTITVIGAAFILLGVFLLVGHFVARGARAALARASFVFIAVWLALAAINMWVGVTRAGYSVAAEAPIFLIVFGVPAATAAAIGSWNTRAPR